MSGDADADLVAAMVEFEVALAHSEESVGLLPRGTAAAIEDAAARLDAADLARDAATPAIALVDRLVELAGDEAGRYVHLGATSQDAIDTAVALVVMQVAEGVLSDLLPACDVLLQLADEHRHTVMPARTLLQQASPTTFGLVAATWSTALRDAAGELALAIGQLTVQLGGAAGTRAVLGVHADEVTRRVGERLGLLPGAPWHTARVPVARIGAALAIVSGTVAKIARDIVLLSQTEVGEVSERARGATSSAMPHKRNAVAAIDAIAAARRAGAAAVALLGDMDHELQRAAGAWQAEAGLVTDALSHTRRAAAHVRESLAALEVEPDRMRANLGTSGAWASELVAARLAPLVGRAVAHDAVGRAAHASSLRRGLEADPRVADLVASLGDVFDDPLAAAGPVDVLIDRAIAEGRTAR